MSEPDDEQLTDIETNRVRARKEIEADVAAFFARGGTVTVVKSGVSNAPLVIEPASHQQARVRGGKVSHMTRVRKQQ